MAKNGWPDTATRRRGDGKRRRESMSFVGTALAWPLAPRARQAKPPKVPRIGVLVPTNAEPFFSVFKQGLSEQGYVEGQNILFEFRSADGKPELLRGLAEGLVRLEVDVIVVWTGIAAPAAQQASKKIPIVMSSAADPVGMGLVASLARPGGNITGMSSTSSELGPKLLEFIRALLPRKEAAELALAQRLPAVSFNGLFPREGGLLSYSPNQNEVYQRSAHYIDRILKGAKPADLPVEQPTRYELIINLQTAKALGLTIPRELRIHANEVIE